MSVGKRIRLARKNAGLTLDTLARLIGVATQTIFKYENEIITNIPLDRIEKIASALSVSPAYLMGWEDGDELPAENSHIKLRITIANTLKELRKENNVTISAVAGAIGLSDMAYHKLERGLSNPSLDTLILIADFFDVPIDYFIRHENSSTPSMELTSHQKKVIEAYIAQPEMQGAVDRLLGI